MSLKNRQGLTEEEFLEQYDSSKYDRPSVTVDMLIFTIIDNKLKLLMVKRSNHPSIGQWALPGGFINMDENLDEAAQRELREETSLDNIYMQQVYTWGDVGRDPRTRIISVAYMALVNSTNLNVKSDDDADDATWFTVSCKLEKKSKSIINNENKIDFYYRLVLDNDIQKISALLRVRKIFDKKSTKITRTIIEVDNIAVDHAKIIEHTLEILKTNVKNTSIIFNIMPDIFSLDELKQVYEVLLDKKFSYYDFNRKVSHMVIKHNDKYKYNIEYMEN